MHGETLEERLEAEIDQGIENLTRVANQIAPERHDALKAARRRHEEERKPIYEKYEAVLKPILAMRDAELNPILNRQVAEIAALEAELKKVGDVCAELRAILDPQSKNHWSVDGLLKEVARLHAAAGLPADAPQAYVTSQGVVKVPSHVLQRLQLAQGGGVVFLLQDDGALILSDDSYLRRLGSDGSGSGDGSDYGNSVCHDPGSHADG